ncbi:hypothetical protein H5410_060504 [Solanum commersonii]|uniref:Uncharacterized protein n=1 Tax=Solanum commersonii TaxID=4109 RepID=A0A9J5W5E2_SOLCO|nr:hypothetical protein H5410_060504 [Solanum commersonii]
METFEKLGLKHVVKTTAETITIDTLTLRGLPENFIAALRDGRNHNWKKSLIGTIQTSLAYELVHFNAYHNLQTSLKDDNSLSSLMLNVKLHGYVIAIKNETIVIETNFGKSKVVTKRPIRWEEIDFPQKWVIEGDTQPKNNINDEVSEIEQLNDGTVKIRFSDPISMHNRSDDCSMSSRSNLSYTSPIDYIVQVPSRASTSQIRENYRCDNIKIDKDNIARLVPKPNSDLDITKSKMNFPDGLAT